MKLQADQVGTLNGMIWPNLCLPSLRVSPETARNRDHCFLYVFLMSCSIWPQWTWMGLFLVRPLCWKQCHRGKLSQQGDGLQAVYRVVVNGKWPSRLRFAKTNYLELLAVFIALKHFLPFLQYCHILISSHRSATIPYITSRRGGCSPHPGKS